MPPATTDTAIDFKQGCPAIECAPRGSCAQLCTLRPKHVLSRTPRICMCNIGRRACSSMARPQHYKQTSQQLQHSSGKTSFWGRCLTALVRMIPYKRPYLMFGRVTFQKTCQSEAPMVRAASSSAKSMVSSMGISSRTTKGMVTKRVARAIPVPTRDDSQNSSKGEGRRKKKVKKRPKRPKRQKPAAHSALQSLQSFHFS